MLKIAAGMLARLSRGRADGSAGPVAQAARRRLVTAGDRGDLTAIVAVWAAWLGDTARPLLPDVGGWPVPDDTASKVGIAAMEPGLSAGNRLVLATVMASSTKVISAAWYAYVYYPERSLPAELAKRPVPKSAVTYLVFAAEDSRRSAGNRAAIGALIPAGELATWKPERLAKFCALTGQAARLAADADGSVLADVYRAADGPTRSAVREAIAGVPELDLVRVVAGAPGVERLSRVTLPEREYLVDELARREEWARLWEFATGLPLAGAAAVARQFAGRWRFPDADSQRLPDLLAGADPEALAADQDALAGPAPLRLETGAEPRSCSFSADGKWAVVTVLSSGRNVTFGITGSGRDLAAGEDLAVDWLLFGLPGGNLAERSRRAGILYDARLADRWENRAIRPAVAVDGRVFGLHEAPAKQAYPASAQQMILPYPGGFVREDVILPGRGVPPPYQGGQPHDGTLTFFDADGRELRRVGFHQDLGLPDGWHYGLTAADPGSGRILVYSGERVWLLDRLARGVLASSPADTFVEAAAFLDPDHLAMVSSAPGGHSGPYLRIWRVQGDTIEIETEQPDRLSPHALAVFPDRGEIATVDRKDQLRWLDARTLTEIGSPTKSSTPLWDAPDGRSFARPAADGAGVDVFLNPPPARVTGLTSRPLADMKPADLAAVTAALGSSASAGPSPARTRLELLRDYLQLRFGTGRDAG